MDGLSSYDGPTMRIVLEVPIDVYHLEFTVKTVDENGETQVFTGRMGLAEIRAAREDYTEPGGRILSAPTSGERT